MDKARVGVFLKDLREKSGKKQSQIALELTDYGIDVSDKTVAKWEKGNFPDIDKLDILADYYGVSPAEILDGERYIDPDFAAEYFTINDKWLQEYPVDELYKIRIEQEKRIKRRVKALFLMLIKSKSLSKMENDELNFLLVNFYSASKYAEGIVGAIKKADANKQVKILRSRIYAEILTMHECSEDEIYWEICKYFNYKQRVTFENTLCDYEDNINVTEEIINELDDWEKDILLAQIQTTNVNHRYGRQSKRCYFQHFKKDYDEEKITKDGIRLLIRCGARINQSLLGYKEHKKETWDILNRMESIIKYEDPNNDIGEKILVCKINPDDGLLDFYWIDNVLKNRLLDLYYAVNVSRREKVSLDKLYDLFIGNESIPDELLIPKIESSIKDGMSDKEIIWLAEDLCPYEIETWNKAKKREGAIVEKQKEVTELERLWENGERTIICEKDVWIGEKQNVLTENDIIKRLSQMTYEQYKGSRDEKLTSELLDDIDKMSLAEIRQKYFPIEVRYGQE